MTNGNKCPGTKPSKQAGAADTVHLDTVHTHQAIQDPRLQIVSDVRSPLLGMLGVLGARLETIEERIWGEVPSEFLLRVDDPQISRRNHKKLCRASLEAWPEDSWRVRNPNVRAH